MSKDAEIKFTIKLDQAKVPEQIFWEASDADFEGKKPCDSIMISMWDKEAKNTMSIDLWTNNMEIGGNGCTFFILLL